MPGTQTEFARDVPQRRLRAIARRLSIWYAHNARDLPWRRVRDPYAIWVSEIMLQQTQVDAVQPYFERWLQTFPDIRALAAAPIDEVLRQWEGLGYYSRARNLHRAAQIVLREHGGRLPATRDALRKLPGIGPYTAAAIASIAFGADAAVVDGNVKRVLARLFLYEGDTRSTRGLRDLQALADRLIPTGRAGDHNQASMDLGATICTPRQPRCAQCPLRTLCVSYREGAQGRVPRTALRRKIPVRRALIGVVADAGRVLVEKRQTRLLGGLWAFPFIYEADNDLPLHPQDQDGRQQKLRQALETLLGLSFKPTAARLGEFTHTYTHFRVVAQVWRYAPDTERPVSSDGAIWAHTSQLIDLPMGRLDRRIAGMLSIRTRAQPNTNPQDSQTTLGESREDKYHSPQHLAA